MIWIDWRSGRPNERRHQAAARLARHAASLVVLSAAFAVLAPREACAQQDDAQTQRGESLLVWMFRAQGIFFYPQLGISIGLVALIVTNFLAIRRTNFLPLEFTEQFEELVKGKKYNEAFELSKQEISLVGRLLAAGLGRLPEGYAEAIQAMQEVGEEENMRYEHRLSYLALIGNIAMLLGLLGTVWGMVASFMAIGQSDVAPKPSELARGVSQALVTTLAGLIQAIPAIFFFTVFKNRVAIMVLEVGVVSERLMQRFRGVVVRRASDTAPSRLK